MTFKKPELEKTLRNGLIMSETDLLNHKWLDFAIQSGLALHQLKKTAVKDICQEFPSMHFDQNMDCYETILLS